MGEILFDAICADRSDMWCVDHQSGLYHIDLREKTIRYLCSLCGNKSAGDRDVIEMAVCDGEVLLTPWKKGYFRKYDPAKNVVETISDLIECSGFCAYYVTDEGFGFVSSDGELIAFYDSKIKRIRVERVQVDGPTAKYDWKNGMNYGGPLYIRGDLLYMPIYGTDRFYVIDTSCYKVVETIKTDSGMPLAFGFLYENGFFYVTLDGEFYLKEGENIRRLDKPQGLNKPSVAPFNSWTHFNGEILLFPCGLNRVLLFDGNELTGICDAGNEPNWLGRRGYNRACRIGNGIAASFDQRDGAFCCFDIENKKMTKYVLQTKPDDAEAYIGQNRERNKYLTEGRVGIGLREFVKVVGGI